MAKNILITGGAGYIGGSVLGRFKSVPSGPIKDAVLHASVRSKEHVEILSKIGVHAILLDLSDAAALKEAVLAHEIDFIINTTSSHELRLVSNQIEALGERRKVSGAEVVFVQSSIRGGLDVRRNPGL